ncbi:hypothetical protein ACUHMQ_21375, partial [Chitinimonas sp. PSY-7]
RFVGLRSSSQIPDRTTLWTFKERLIAAGASNSIFEATNRQLASKPPASSIYPRQALRVYGVRRASMKRWSGS